MCFFFGALDDSTGRTSVTSSYGVVCEGAGDFTATLGTFACPAGGAIATAAECEAAGKALGKTMSSSGRSMSSSSYPKGCFSVSSASIYFNTHSTGRTSSSMSYSAVCKGTAKYAALNNIVACPQGLAAVGDEAECKAAAAVAGRTYSGSTSSTSYPKGCSSTSSTVYWNTHSTGRTSPSASYGLVCEVVAEVTTLAAAKASCLEQGAACKAVTCKNGGTTDCTARSSMNLLESTTGETTHAPKCETIMGSMEIQENKVGKLAKLAQDAGFDFVNYTDPRYVALEKRRYIFRVGTFLFDFG